MSPETGTQTSTHPDFTVVHVGSTWAQIHVVDAATEELDAEDETIIRVHQRSDVFVEFLNAKGVRVITVSPEDADLAKYLQLHNFSVFVHLRPTEKASAQ